MTNMRKFSIIILISLTAFAQTMLHAQKTVWHNPEEAGYKVVHAQAYPNEHREGFYHRFTAEQKVTTPKTLWRKAICSAGESLVFRTDSKNIIVRYKVSKGHAMYHMPTTGVSGVDLYTTDKHGDEVWVAGKYTLKDTIVRRYGPIDLLNKPKMPSRYTLFLPLYNEVTWLEIGVDEGSYFKFEPLSPALPIVAYGTSICQGACASRPGMAWTNILQRRLGVEVINLGFSGSAYLEQEVMDLIAGIDSRLYIIDAMPNAYTLEADQLRDTLLRAVRSLRNDRPDKPILLVDHLGYPQGKAVKTRRDALKHALDVQKEVYDQLISEGMKGLYYLSHAEIALPQDGTVEGDHASDYGMMAYAIAYEKKVREILNMPIGTISTTIPVVQERCSYNWMDRQLQILNDGKGKHFARVLIGDSIMHYWAGVEGSKHVRGAESWSQFKGATLNMGCGFDRVENVLWRIYSGQLDALTADNIILAIGTNNLGHNTNEEIVEGVRYVLQAIKARRPEAEITLMGILPRRRQEARVKSINKLYKAVAKEMKVNYSDPGVMMLQKDGKINESLFTDGLHPNETGYHVLMPAFAL